MRMQPIITKSRSRLNLWLHTIAASTATLMLLLLFGSAVFAQSEVPFDIDRIHRATVYITQVSLSGTEPIIHCQSTGTLISRDGLILTNAHSTLVSVDCPGDTLMIALSTENGQPPITTYQAEVVQANEGLDLAILQINREFDGRIIESGSLALPFVEFADSNTVQLDNTIWVVGYPGIADDPVVEVRASVLGFMAEPGGSGKSWFKIEVDPAAVPGEIGGTMSGGGAYNRDGQLIGIPTTAPITRQDVVTECRIIQDTNNDGLINQNDNCLPLGGSINVLRPSNFARPLFQGAYLGLQLEQPTNGSSLPLVIEQPVFIDLFFASSISNELPTTVINSLPAGSNSLYLFFDYRNMTPETVYELQVNVQGTPRARFSLSPVRWSGGQNGLWFIGTEGQPLPNGTYEFTLSINGVQAADPAIITVGGAAEETPSFRSPEFALFDDDGNAFGEGYILGVGSAIEARFIYNNIPSGTTWTQEWLYNGTRLGSPIEDDWSEAEASGSKTIRLEATNGFPPGTYRLKLYIEGRLATLADFVVAGAREAAFPRVFSNTHFVVAESPVDAISAQPISTFSNTTERIYAMFNWEQISPGTLWQMRWSIDGIPFYNQIVPWAGQSSGENYLIEVSAVGGLPDGEYRLELLINNVVLQSETLELGIGQLPIDPLTEAEGVQLRGQIIDAATGEGIPNLTIIIISEEFSIEDYVGQRDQVYALAMTDRNGVFQLDRPLQYDAPYSLLIAADGYLPIPADGVTVTRESPNPLDMVISLTRG
jgi:S1-C subfamily serine protease